MKIVALALLFVSWLLPLSAQAKDAPDTAYDRILNTHTLRCGYSVWNPLFGVDANTGEKSGIFYDVMEELGKRMGIKIIWQEELGWGTVIEGLKTGRVDMACAGYYLSAPRIMGALSTTPQIYSPVYIWVRQDDSRAHKVDDLNSDKFTLAMIDGDAENPAITARFPKAKIVSLPELASTPDLLANLNSKKIDFFLADISTLKTYIANNPGKIRNAFPSQPLSFYPTVMLLPPGDFRLKDMIDNMLHNIEYDGTFDKILEKYHVEHDYLRNALPALR